jgi:hypothetical protein
MGTPGSKSRGGWIALAASDLTCAAVYPVGDLREHDPDNAACWCQPTYDDGVLMHHSMDGREAYETGKAPS